MSRSFEDGKPIVAKLLEGRAMKNSLKVNKQSFEPCLLKVELRISTEVESLSGETLDKLEQVIVTSVTKLLRSTTKKDPNSKLISNLTLFEPEFRSESRYLVSVFPSSSASKTE